MELTTIPDAWMTGAGISGAVVAGLVASGHCGLMCGPLACAAAQLRSDGNLLVPLRRRARTALSWQFGRIGAYTIVGALLGWFGDGAQTLLSGTIPDLLPWFMVAGLLVIAFDLGKRLRPLPGIGWVTNALMGAAGRFAPASRAALMGLVTPLLPCGVLYGVFLAAWATGNAIGGAIIMLAFGLGGVPTLLGLQLGGGHLANVLQHHPRLIFLVRRGLPLIAAGVIVWRALSGDTFSPACH